ncbi:aminotransferase class I/II-fold pyridoxal phosphate-dependent enzyme, partial [Candidatus Woesearchaeota archaeon]|nr:aminotransferase class I/II-fold pyridoxal phosphate-dependent enzyme [Candidatus Woesearchaeota archaeon]
INLTVGQPNFPIPNLIKKAAIKAINNNLNSYVQTTGIKELKDAVSNKLLKKNKIKAKPEDIIITSAVSGGLSIALDALIDPNDEVIIFDPFFVAYLQVIRLKNGKPIVVKTNPDYTINYEDLNSKISKKTKAIIINSPNNPTGKVYSEKELRKLAQIAKKNKITIISDEIYEDFVYDSEHFSVGSIYNNTISLFGFSKSHSMTGWRVGYMTGPKEIIQECVKSQQFNFVCSPTPFQYAAVEALKIDMSKYIKDFKKKRDFVYSELKDYYEIIKPEGAFYMFIKSPYNTDEFIQDCIKNKLLVVPGKTFSKKNTHFRISFSNEMDVLKRGVEVLKELSNKN